MYRFLPLRIIKQYEPEMRQEKVSIVARSPRGFLTAYKRIKGKPSKLNLAWHKKRNSFIARHLAQYRKNPTYRRKLALIAWAYMP